MKENSQNYSGNLKQVGSFFLSEYLTNSTFLEYASVFQEKVFRIWKDRRGNTSHDSNFPTETPKK